MATPYLQQPNYLGAMQTGLGNRLAYDKFNQPKSRGGIRVSSGSGSQSTSAGPIGSPEERAARRKNALAEEAAVQAVEQSKQKTEAEMQETVAKGVKTAASYAKHLTTENYDDWYDWVSKSDPLLKNMYMEPEAVYKFTPEQRTQYFAKIGETDKPDNKAIKNAIEMYKAENAMLAKQNKNILDREKQAKLDANRKAIIDLKEKELKQKADLAAKKTTSEGRKFNELTADQEYEVTLKEEDKLLETENNIFGTDEEGKSYAADKQGTKAYVDAFNRRTKKLNIPEKIIWSDEAVVEVPGRIYGTNKIPGYVKVPVEEISTKVQERTTPKEEIEAMKSGEIFWVDGKQYRRK